MAGKLIGILTSGGDCPGLNAAIRAVGKAADSYDMELIGFLNGFQGLVKDQYVRLGTARLSGILTHGGTILGTSRDKPHRMPVGDDQVMDMTPMAVATYRQHHLDALVCLGGGGTLKNAYRLSKEGLDVITLPKTIDNDVAETDVTFGFDTAMTIAAEAIDRLHTTADSHHRVIIVEIMGHNVGWLTLGAGVAGGADVILIPEIPYRIESVINALLNRYRQGKRFSIVAIAEGAVCADECDVEAADSELLTSGVRLSRAIGQRTSLESRVTVLGHLQRGGTPTPADRLLATRLGTYCADLIHQGVSGVMVASRGDACLAVPLEDAAGKRKEVPRDHPWIESARRVGTSFGDE
jgi:ATP-dependent phosphofructokinase / diphosphate-dependent phosphofructokinase